MYASIKVKHTSYMTPNGARAPQVIFTLIGKYTFCVII